MRVGVCSNYGTWVEVRGQLVEAVLAFRSEVLVLRGYQASAFPAKPSHQPPRLAIFLMIILTFACESENYVY